MKKKAIFLILTFSVFSCAKNYKQNQEDTPGHKCPIEHLRETLDENDLSYLRKIIEDDIDVNKRYHEYGLTLLMVAAGYQNLDAMKLLLENGSDVNLKDNYEHGTALFHIDDSDLAAQLLVDYGADVNILFYDYGDINFFTQRMTQPYYYTALTKASEFGNFGVVKVLVEAGADINTSNTGNKFSEGFTPLILACENGDETMARYLIRQGASLPEDCTDIYNPVKATAIDLAFAYAASSNLIEYLPYYFSKGADINIKLRNERTALINASIHNFNKVIEFLIENNADPNIADYSGYTPLMYLTENEEMVRLLVENGAKVNKQNMYGGNAMQSAARENSIAVLHILINAGGDLTIGDEYNRTPIYNASLNGHLEAVKILIRAGADVNVKTIRGFTPLMEACKNGDLEIVKLLINNGANRTSIDTYGKSAIDYAIENKNRDIIVFLRNLEQ